MLNDAVSFASDLLSDVDADTVQAALNKLDVVARESVRSSLAGKDPANCLATFSGGIDSSILAVLSNKVEKIRLFSLGEDRSSDVQFLKGLNLMENKLDPPIIKTATKSEIEEAGIHVARLLELSSLSQLEDCTAFYLIAKKLLQDFRNATCIITANGPDELFCGYDRFRRLADSGGYATIDEEISRSLQVAYRLKDDVKAVLQEFGLSSIDPFLSEDFVELSRQIPVDLKIMKGNDRLRKRVWRLYGRTLGLPDSIVLKPKKAMQYSMGVHQTLIKIVRRGEIRIPKTTK